MSNLRLDCRGHGPFLSLRLWRLLGLRVSSHVVFSFLQVPDFLDRKPVEGLVVVVTVVVHPNSELHIRLLLLLHILHQLLLFDLLFLNLVFHLHRTLLQLLMIDLAQPLSVLNFGIERLNTLVPLFLFGLNLVVKSLFGPFLCLALLPLLVLLLVKHKFVGGLHLFLLLSFTHGLLGIRDVLFSQLLRNFLALFPEGERVRPSRWVYSDRQLALTFLDSRCRHRPLIHR